MATNNPQDNLARRVLEKDLSIIAKSIGSNWELLAPYLLDTNGTTTVEQIKADHAKTEMRIFYLLLTWSKEAGPDATLGLLFHKMQQPGTSVMIEWRTIAKKLDINEREIRACKEGYRQPVQETNANETMTTETETGGPVSGNISSLQKRWGDKSNRSPKETCIFDGRLIELAQEDIEDLKKNCTIFIGRGSFGEVYRSHEDVGGFGMKIAIKKIKLVPGDEDTPKIIKSIRREMVASRILHPFILPLLAVVDYRPSDAPREFWFVSPFFEKHDLQKAIGDKRNPLEEKDRVKILLHLATAIHYIHTEVPNVRNAILHKDISSKNVVLDQAYNARLIDFGLAREKDDESTREGGKSCYQHPDWELGKPATECWDYYSFGVIVREMLTGLGPQGEKDGKILKKMTHDDVCKILKKNNLWSSLGNDEVLNNIAYQCLDSSKGLTLDEFKTEVVKRIKSRWDLFCLSKILDVQDTKCHMCMINPATEETSLTQKHAATCQQNIEVCIACEKNSFLNPITCYCGEKLAPFGSRWGALLIAGNDNDKKLADALTRDVTELKKLLTSKAPCIVGISEHKVRMVTPSCHDNTNSKEQQLLLPGIKENVKYFKEQKEMDTLLIYFSGHCAWDKESRDAKFSSFKLGSDSEILTLADFEKLMDDLGNIDKLIIILDRCYPPKISFENKNRKVIQINACEESEKADMSKKESLFTKILIQGLKGKAHRLGCSEVCKYCKEYFDKSSDFITVYSLFEYLKNHIEDPKPRMIQDAHSDSSNIAYFTDEQVKIQFTDMKTGERQSVQLDYFQDMEQLQIKLCEDFGKKKNEYNVKVQRDTFRKDEQFEDCDTIEKVMAAWVQRQPLIVQFESI